MKIFAVFLCGFLFLLFAGTTTYIYILWTSYWQQIAKYTSYEDSLKNNNIRNSKNFANFRHIGPPAPPDNTVQKPEVVNSKKNLVKSNDEEKERAELDLPLDKLMMHVRHYKTQIISQLRSAVISTGQGFLYWKKSEILPKLNFKMEKLPKLNIGIYSKFGQ